MVRRPPIEEDDVSLFPFLSIIAAVIGVLTLMIAAVTLGQMNQGDVKEAMANAIAMDRLQKELAGLEDLVEKLNVRIDKDQAALLADAKERQNELVKTRAELDALVKELSATQERAAELKEIKIVIPEVPKSERESLADIKAKQAMLNERLAALRIQLEKRINPPDEAEVSVLPGGTGLSFTPHFVECTASAIVLHDEAKPITIRREAIGADAKFTGLLETVVNANNHSIVFLVRSDSLATYRAAKRLCDQNGVRNGKLPAVGNGRLDFSHFRKGK